ncbi:Mini-ribonuclease 3 [Geminocystis sp. NIES-3708]|uniref:Mini-ribonuclease 3 n=1 Tax=Geminocystis sp. NIES-3708 TaxID=1615909 RepID=UPI00082E569A|nr:ribonuclease III domain-containing protein [Geminocystis sp. NIES-3708]
MFNGEISASSLQQISPVSFAYIGDAVYELYIRTNFLLPSKKISDYHHKVVEKVRAESQASYLQNLYPLLTEIELNWVRRGRNSVNKSPRRLPLQTYQQATGLETLLGYLYICDRPRLEYLLSQIKIY